jgi:nitric oxide reductase NorD protein
MIRAEEYKEQVRAELVQILGRSTFGKDFIEQRFTGVHYARGLMSIDAAVDSIVTLDPKTKEEVYELGRELARRDSEMAYHYFRTASDAIKHFNAEDMRKWVDKGIQFFENYGKVPGRNFFKGITRETIEEIHSVGLDLDKVSRILEIYVDALSGGRLSIQGSEETYTDTRTIFLPTNVSDFESNEDNFKIFKVIAAHKYGQMRYRSFDLHQKRMADTIAELRERYGKEPIRDVSVLENFFDLFPDKALALDIYNIVENTRVETYLTKEFKGLKRDMDFIFELAWKARPDFAGMSKKQAAVEALLQKLYAGRVKRWLPKDVERVVERGEKLVEKMLRSRATAEDSAKVTAKIYQMIDEAFDDDYRPVPEIFYRGGVKPARVTMALRQTEKELSERLRRLMKEMDIEPPEDLDAKIIDAKNEVLDPLAHGAPLEFLQRLNVQIPDEIWEMIKKEIERRLGELGEIDASLLTKVLDSAGRMVRAEISAQETKFQVELTEEDMAGAFLYDEWDHEMGHYRAKWCALRERVMRRGDEKFVEKTLEKYLGLVHLVRRQFEMLRPEYKKLKKQLYGEEIDIDAFIEAKADIEAGVSPSEKLYIKADKRERDIAVAFLVDLSGSTTGWVIETEKEALVLMCEALEVLGDKYAIFGFSGKTRKQCDFYMIKDFEEKYDDDVRAKIAGMDAFDYTRMGPPIRHLNDILDELPAKVKIMIILSDGKPEDFDEYKGDHGIEDTRKALIEAKRKHIKPFCITIDKEAKDYISHMYGDVSYIILDDVKDLPRKLPEVYRRLTT